MDSEIERALMAAAISPLREVISYEWLWAGLSGVGLDRLEGVLKGRRPSVFYSEIPEKNINEVGDFLDRIGAKNYNVLFRDTVDYPKKLHVLELPLYIF